MPVVAPLPRVATLVVNAACGPGYCRFPPRSAIGTSRTFPRCVGYTRMGGHVPGARVYRMRGQCAVVVGRRVGAPGGTGKGLGVKPTGTLGMAYVPPLPSLTWSCACACVCVCRGAGVDDDMSLGSEDVGSIHMSEDVRTHRHTPLPSLPTHIPMAHTGPGSAPLVVAPIPNAPVLFVFSMK